MIIKQAILFVFFGIIILQIERKFCHNSNKLNKKYEILTRTFLYLTAEFSVTFSDDQLASLHSMPCDLKNLLVDSVA